MKKRILSIFLTVALVIGILPQMTMPVQAADPAPVYAVLTSTGLFEATSAAPTIATNMPIHDNDKYTITNLFVANDVKSVTYIFEYCVSLKSVKMPEVVSISDQVFQDCKALTEVEMPKVKTIGNKSFYRCESLKTLEIPALTTLGDYAFYGCKVLTSANIPELQNVSNFAFWDCPALTTVDISKVTAVGKDAFKACKSLTIAEMPEVTSIDQGAFSGCESLTAVTMPKVESIGYDGFGTCKKLAVVEMESVITVGANAFINGIAITNLKLPNAKTINASAFYGCKELKTIEIPIVEKIMAGAFGSCSSLKKVEMINATEIRNTAFQNCVDLETVVIPNIKSILMLAFDGCKSLANLTVGAIPPTVTNGNPFVGCPTANNLTIDGSTAGAVAAYKAAADSDKTDNLWYGWTLTAPLVYGVLKSDGKVYETNSDNTTPTGTVIDKKTVNHLYVASNVTIIDNGAFADCTALTTVTMPKVTEIGSSAFSRCTSLTTVTIPKVTEIGGTAFANCAALETVTMLKATIIWKSAFENCTALTTVTMPEVTTIGSNAFLNCTKLTMVTMPNVTEIGFSAFQGCIALTTVAMPEVTEIGSSAFEGCTVLANLTVGATPPTVAPDVFKACSADRKLTIDGSTVGAVNAYKAANDGNTTDNSWYGWTLPISPSTSTYDVTGTVKDNTNTTVSGATVKLMKGNTPFGETKTDLYGVFKLEGIPNGTYNLVVSKNGIIVTTIIVVNNVNCILTSAINLPNGKTNSILEVTGGAPSVVVKGLDEQFSNDDIAYVDGKPDNKIEIKLVVDKKQANDIKQDAEKIATVSNGKKIGLILDLSIVKTITDNGKVGKSKKQPNIPNIIEIIVPLSEDLKGKTDLTLYRVHSGIAQALQNGKADSSGEYFAVSGSEMRIYTKNFSTYAIAYKDTTGGGTTNGGSTEVPTHNFSEIEKLIIDLPAVENFKKTDMVAFEKVEKEYNKLTNDEKTVIDEFLHNKYKAIAKQAETMRKAAEKPVIVKPIPVIAPKHKPTSVPKTGDETPMSLPITFVTLGLALMALGFYLKGKGKQIN